MRPRSAIFIVVLGGYIAIFALQQRHGTQAEVSLTPPLPTIVLQATTGLFRELCSEMLFVKCAVFNGTNLSRAVVVRNADSMSLNLDVATALYPEFTDPYYLSQAALPHISTKYATLANDVLNRYPGNDIIIPFFRGFNYFYYMDQPQSAAEVFAELSKRDDAPTWFGHFAAILTAKGGNLYAGLISLQSMLAVETDEFMRQRYKADIEVFKQAISVQKATDHYRAITGEYPVTLEALVPNFIPEIPKFKNFSLEWKVPVLKLVRPNRRTNLSTLPRDS